MCAAAQCETVIAPLLKSVARKWILETTID
jgi:hypothetical protein